MNRHLHSPAPRAARQGFTLFEVGISMLLVSFGVVSVLMVFPVGLRQTQTSRYKVLAAAKAVELIDSFSGTSDESRTLDIEVPEAWEGKTFAYSNCRWDLEQHTCNFRYGIHPLPMSIARRLDSGGDEIQRILDGGAQLYYAMPMANSNLDERWQNSAPMNEAKSMIFAVVGCPQHNAIPRLPQKAWPYHYPYPSPPMFTDGGYVPYSASGFNWYKNVPGSFWARISSSQILLNDNGADGQKFVCLEWWLGGNANRLDHVVSPTDSGFNNEKLKNVFMAYLDYAYDHDGAKDVNKTDLSKPPKTSLRRAYIQSVIDYCKDVFTSRLKIPMPSGGDPAGEFNQFYLSSQSLTDDALQNIGTQYDRTFAQFCSQGENPVIRPLYPNIPNTEITRQLVQTRVEAALRVQCMRFLAHAMATLYTNNRIRRLEEADDVREPANLGDSTIIGNYTITPGIIRYLHERSLAMGMHYAACFPYDWGQPRPQQRNIMVDIPLIELDLFSPPREGKQAGQIKTAQWKPIPAQPISNLGPSSSFPGTLDASGTWRPGVYPYKEWDAPASEQTAFWGNPDHFTLTKTFEPAERCRQLVFWSVDWQTYEDFELAPAAPVDASRHPFAGPANNSSPTDIQGRLAAYGNAWRNADSYFMLHPEVRMLYAPVDPGLDMNSLPTGTNISDYDTFGRDRTINVAARTDKAFCGLYGADRNFNRQLDRGPVSPNIRMRASLISRFNFYDPRIPVVMR